MIRHEMGICLWQRFHKYHIAGGIGRDALGGHEDLFGKIIRANNHDETEIFINMLFDMAHNREDVTGGTDGL